MTKRGYFLHNWYFNFPHFGTWFAYEKYWEYRVKEGAKALGYELNDEEVKYWVKRIRSYNKLMALMKILRNLLSKIRFHLLQSDGFLFIGSSSIRFGVFANRTCLHLRSLIEVLEAHIPNI